MRPVRARLVCGTVAALALPAPALASDVAVRPALAELPARSGVVTTLRVSNPGREEVEAFVDVRRWRHLSDGRIVPDDRRSGDLFPQVRAIGERFRLRPGTARSVPIRVDGRAPRWLYAAVVTRVRALVPRRTVEPTLRVVTALRLLPRRRRLSLRVDRPRRRRGRVTVRITNRGNLVVPVSGVVEARRGGRVRRLALRRQPVLPGRSAGVPADGRLTGRGWRLRVVVTQRDGRRQVTARAGR